MRCEICQTQTPESESNCSGCKARLVEDRHRELFGVRFVIGQLVRWEKEGWAFPATAKSLRSRYVEKRDRLIAELKPAPPAEPARSAEILEIKELPPVEIVEPISVETPPEAPKPAPPPKSFAWSDLFTERNIRWILNLGIFIFSAALVVFVHSQWTGMTAGVKTAILFGATAVAFGAGHFLRGTLLRETGMALIVLAAIALPIDFLGMVHFKLISASNALGLVGSVACLGLYMLGATLYRAPLFAWLSAAAAGSVAAFGLATGGVPWLLVPAWVTPILAATVPISNRLPAMFRGPAWWGGIALTASGIFLALAFWTVGMTHAILPIEVALTAAAGSAFALALQSQGRGGCAYGAPKRDPTDSTDISGDSGPVESVEISGICGFQAASSPSERNRRGFEYVGFLLLGFGVAFGAYAWKVPIVTQPVLYAGYAALVAAATIRRFRAAGTLFAILGAGAAMFVVALRCLDYYYREFGLGVAACAASAAAFALIAHRTKSRLVADLAYGSFGFATIYALRWIGLPPQWLGVAGAGLAVTLFVLHRRLRLLAPTLFTGAAAAVGCTALAFVQWLVAAQYAPAIATLAIVAIFSVAVAAKTEYRWAYHFGLYLGAAAILCGCDAAKLAYAQRLVAVLPLAVLALVAAHRKGENHLGAAGFAILLAVLAFTYLNPAMYREPNLPYAIGVSLTLASLAAYATFVKPERVDLRATSGVMGAAASVAYVLFLKWLSTGSPWGGLVVLAMAFVLAGAAWLLRREPRRAHPLLWVAIGVTVAAAVVGHLRGTWTVPAYLGVYALGLALHAAVARGFRRGEFVWTSAALTLGLGLSLLHYLHHYTPWAGAIVFALVPACIVLRRTPFDIVAPILTIACAAVAWTQPTICTAILFTAFALYAAAALWKRSEVAIYLATILAALAEFRFLLEHGESSHIGLLLLPAVVLFLATAYAIRVRYDAKFSFPLLVFSIVTALVATVLGYRNDVDRILLFLADTALFALIAIHYRKPWLMYAASLSLIALDVSVMARMGASPTITAIELLALALAQLVLVRLTGDRFKEYAAPMLATSLMTAVGVLLFGAWKHETFTGRDINWAIWGMMLAGLVHGVAGRIRWIPPLIGLAACHLLGAYYLILVKYHISGLEFFTLPVGAGLVAWSAFRKSQALEAIGIGAVFLPSAVSSFLPNGVGHTIAAFVLSFGLVLVGMVLRRRVLAIGGTACFIAEVLGKVVEFLVRADLSLAQWGMILGGLMIVLAGAFESRKLKFVRENVEGLKGRARQKWEKWA